MGNETFINNLVKNSNVIDVTKEKIINDNINKGNFFLNIKSNSNNPNNINIKFSFGKK